MTIKSLTPHFYTPNIKLKISRSETEIKSMCEIILHICGVLKKLNWYRYFDYRSKEAE